MNLLHRIERFLWRSGMTATRFGRAAINDPGFVRQLRNGREPRPETTKRILDWIEKADPPLRRRRSRKAREDAATALLRALEASLARCECTFRVHELHSRSWASVTFTGARHRILFTLEGPGATPAADALAGRIDEEQLSLRGHILADVALVKNDRAAEDRRVELTLEALTVEDA